MTVKDFINVLDERDKYIVTHVYAEKGTVKTFIKFQLNEYLDNKNLENYYDYEIKNIYYKRSTPYQSSNLIIQLKEE